MPTPQPHQGALQVFVSFAQHDDQFLHELLTHLAPLKAKGLIEIWHAGMNEPGTDWLATTSTKLETARVILLLVSAEFLASDYCCDEVKRGMERHQRGDARVIPVLLRPCVWKDEPFNALPVLPDSTTPISKWTHPDDAYTEVVVVLRNIALGVVTPTQRNQDARKLLAFFYAAYNQVGSRSFTIRPSRGTLTEVGMAEEAYRAAMSRLTDKRLLKGMEIGGGCSITDYGVQASEDEALLGRLLPVEKAPVGTLTIDDQRSDMTTQKPDAKKVFIIHGRNVKARKALEQFVRSLGLTPIDFEQLAADSGAAPIGEIVRSGLAQAQGLISLFTADEFAFLRPEYHEPHDNHENKERWQARSNVIFEAGMAYGIAADRTILAVLGGQTKLFSDVSGIHLTFLSNSQDARKRLRQKLIGAKCDVDLRSDAWLDPTVSGDFDSCVLPEVSTRDPFRE